MIARLSIVLLLILVSNHFCNGDSLIPVKITAPPEIDGKLDDAVWSQALLVSGFLQRLPQEGAAPTEETEVRLLYTQQALYIGFQAYDSKPQSIAASVMKRDDFDIVTNDQLALAIDSYNDRRNGYWFSTNPLGARVDAQFSDEGNIWESNWNGIWECKARIHEHGWSAELEIPFATLRFHPGSTNIMGINFFRRVIRTNEQLFAPLIPLQFANGTPNVSQATKYVFYGISGGKQLEIKPHAVSGMNHQSAGGTHLDADAGLDLKYSLTDSLRANFSLNTDFAEAEVDERQINLSRFLLFIPEKRDFFLESSGNFQFGLPGQTELFFSRRIGLSNEGETVPILAGARLTGKVQNLDIGILTAQTDSFEQEPAENFTVFRVKAGFLSRSYIGGIATGRTNDHGFAGTYGLDLNLYLMHEIALTGFLASSQNPHNEDSSFHLSLARGGEKTSFQFAYTEIGSQFDPAIGFVQRPGIRRWNSNFFQPFYLQTKRIRNITPGYEFESVDDIQGNFTDTLHRGSLKVVLQSEDQMVFFGRHQIQTVPAPFEIHPDHVVSPGKYESTDAGIELASKPGRRLSGSLLLTSGGFLDGSRTEVTPSVQWKWNRHFTFSQLISTNFVELSGERFQIQLLRSRVNYSFNTQLSVAAILQCDNSSEQWGANVRLRYLFREGTELILVYDETGDDPLDAIQRNRNRRFLMKFTYLFNL